MKKNNLYFSALVLILGLSFTNCHSKSDNSLYQTNALLFNYLNGLLAGNCASIEKRVLSTGTVYQATGTTIPSGGCNDATQGSTFSTSSTTIATNSDAYFDGITAILDKYTACTAASSLVKGTTTGLTSILSLDGFVGTTKAGTTAANIVSKANGNASDSVDSLNNFHPKNCWRVKVGLLNTVGIYCKADADITTAKGNIQYKVIDSVTSDMATSFEGNRDLLKAVRSNYSGSAMTDATGATVQAADSDLNNEVNYYTNSAIKAMRMMTPAEISTLNSTTNKTKVDAYAAVFVAYAVSKGAAAQYQAAAVLGVAGAAAAAAGLSTAADGVLGCFAALSSTDSTTKDYLLRIPSTYRITNFVFNSDITPFDRGGVTTPFVPFLTCKYGNNQTATTTSVKVPLTSTVAVYSTASAAEGICPSTYTQF